MGWAGMPRLVVWCQNVGGSQVPPGLATPLLYRCFFLSYTTPALPSAHEEATHISSPLTTSVTPACLPDYSCAKLLPIQCITTQYLQIMRTEWGFGSNSAKLLIKNLTAYMGLFFEGIWSLTFSMGTFVFSIRALLFILRI